MRKAFAIAVATAVTAAGAMVASVAPVPSAGAAVLGDGTTASTAASSCWAIKQSNPTSATGVYWLQTPTLVAPQQFYCDQTTDGGGWVLVGRGREGWSFANRGQGSASALRNTPSGTAAFAPAALSTETVNGLLNGGRVDQLVDGVRVRRAANTTGSQWQEVRWAIRDTGPWSWAFGGGQLLSSITFDSTTYPISSSAWDSGSTRDAFGGSSSGTRRLYTYPDTAHNLREGFAYGTSVTGANNSSSYLWQYTNEGRALAFAQVFIRPRLTAANVTYPAIPDAGAAASTVRPMIDHRPQRMPAGVTGVLKVDDIKSSQDTPVMAMAQVGSVMYVGGKFSNVQQSGGASTAQPYLAAFDVDTGAWIPSFRPVVDGAVWDLVGTPQGRLIVAGNFTNINGAPNTSGLAALNPATGAIDATWNAPVTQPYSTSVRPYARSLALAGDWLYVAGGFKKIAGGSPIGSPITVSRIARVRVSDGRPDGTWKPVVNGGIVDISISPTGDRAYIAGSFTKVGTTTVNQVAAIDATTTATIEIPWFDNHSSTEPQNTIDEFANGVYLGGSQHYLHRYDRNSFELLNSHITRKGGDFQAMTVIGNTLYASCHCTNTVYSDTTSYNPAGYSRVDPINYILAFDLATNEQIPAFQPVTHASNGEGPWELTPDDRGCLWVGGDPDRGAYDANGNAEWVGGFFRMCPRDATAPTTPTNLRATTSGTDTTLTWSGATDNSGTTPRYEVLRDDRVIATVYGTSFTDTVNAPARYFVRAVDSEDNRSATTPVLAVSPPPSPSAILVAPGSAWRYRADGADLGAAWRQPGYDTGSWASGPAQLGWGDGDESTLIPSAAITQYFVRTFSVANATSIPTARLRLLRDDGATVYVNGIEVARSNLPTGPLGAGTLASSYTWGADESAWYESVIPGALLSTGTNTIAVELHQASAANGDGSFDLELVAGVQAESVAPTTPTALAVTGRTETTIGLGWNASTDSSGIIGYVVRRAGTIVGYTATPAFVDTGLAPSTSHSYSVTAVDGSGNASAVASLVAGTSGNPELVAFASDWRWKYDGVDPGATWTLPGFDDSTWNVGTAELGMGDGDEATIIWSGGFPNPVTAYFRRTFTVADPAAIASLALSVVRDDGVAVYINGVEVARDNLAPGAGHSTLAPNAVWTRADEADPINFAVPPGLLTAGTNTITVEVHQSSQWSADLSFAARLLAGF